MRGGEEVAREDEGGERVRKTRRELCVCACGKGEEGRNGGKEGREGKRKTGGRVIKEGR